MDAKIAITDDAMVVEMYGNKNIFVVNSSYCNIKITTPEDLLLAKSFLRSMGKPDKTGDL